jgi:hypothetical protein
MRLATTLIRTNVLDCYRLADFHQFINYAKKSEENKMTFLRFAGILGS